MVRTVMIVAALVFFAACASATENPTPQTTHVMVRMELDNTVKEVKASEAELKKQIAKELCGVPITDVTIQNIMDDSTTVAGIGNTQTLLYASCAAPQSKLEAVLDDCQDWWNQAQTKDETKDSTSWWSGGEVEVDDIDCRYVENGQFEYFSATDANKATTAGEKAVTTAIVANASEAATTTTSSAASPMAGAAVAALAGAAALLL